MLTNNRCVRTCWCVCLRFSPQHYGRNQKVNHTANVEFFSMEHSRGCLSVLTGISMANGKETSFDVARWKCRLQFFLPWNVYIYILNNVSYRFHSFLNLRMTHSSLRFTTVCPICYLNWKVRIPFQSTPEALQTLQALQALRAHRTLQVLQAL